MSQESGPIGGGGQSEENAHRGNAKNPRARNQQNRFANDRYSNNRQQRDNHEKSRPDRRKMQVDTWQNPSEAYRDAKPSNDDARDNHSVSNNRGKWGRNDRRYQNDRYGGNNRQQNDKPYQASNDHEEQQNFEATTSANPPMGSRRENSHNRESEKPYRSERTRGRHRDTSANFDPAGHSYYDQTEENHERDANNKFDRSRDDIKKSRESRGEESQSWRQKDKTPVRGGMAKKYSKKIEFGRYNNFLIVFR